MTRRDRQHSKEVDDILTERAAPAPELGEETILGLDGGERLVDVRAAARMLGIGQTTVYAWIKDGTIRSVGVGQRGVDRFTGEPHAARRLIPVAEIDRLSRAVNLVPGRVVPGDLHPRVLLAQAAKEWIAAFGAPDVEGADRASPFVLAAEAAFYAAEAATHL